MHGDLTIEGSFVKRVSIGIIGAGFSALFPVEGLKKVHGVNVRFADVTATRPERAADFARAWRELLADRSIDVVSICVPSSMHAEFAMATAKAGKHVIC